MNWSAEQQRLLRALGHELMVHGTAWPTRTAEAVAPTAATSTSASGSARPMRKAPAAPPAIAAASTTAPAREGVERLREALRRASGGADVSALIEDIERLRREPALKRALWPRLRALRRSH